MEKNNKRKLFTGVIITLVVVMLATVSLVSAYKGDPNLQGPNYNEGMHELKSTAMADLDYATWKSLMEDSGVQGRVLDIVTEENFATFVKAHNAALAGNVDLAASLRAELGLGQGPRDGTGAHEGMRGEHQGRQRMHKANFVDADGDGNCDNAGSHSRRH